MVSVINTVAQVCVPNYQLMVICR